MGWNNKSHYKEVNMSNYYVRRSYDDEYLEHGIFQKGYAARNGRMTKYIARINIGGKMRYFYDPRELDAYKRAASGVSGAVSNVRRSVGNAAKAVGNATGISQLRKLRSLGRERSAARSAAKAGVQGGNVSQATRSRLRNANMQYNNMQKAFNKSLLGRAASTASAARSFIGKQATKARKAGVGFAGSVGSGAYNAANAVRRKGLGKAVADASGYTARKAYKQASSAANKGIGKGNATVSKSLLRSKERSKNAYNKTLLGRAERGLDDFQNWADNRRRDALKTVGGARRKVKSKWLKATGKSRKG